MRRRSAVLALTPVLSLVASAAAQPAPPAAGPPREPAVPVAPAPAAEPAPSAAAPPAAPLQNAGQVLQGVVRLERAGRLLGLGVVLRSDGRILGALSPLGHGNFLQARFADGSVLVARVVASDRAWDLALLATEGGYWTEGLRASTLAPPEAGARLHGFRVRGGRLEEAAVGVAARQAALGRDGVLLDDALALAPRLADDELGSPLIDDRGDVAAIATQACATGEAQNCQLVSFGAPVSALKQFLRKAPRREPQPAAYIGLRGVAAREGSVAGVRVVSVDAGSPAERAGLRGASEAPHADLIVSVGEGPVATPEELHDAVNRAALSSSAASSGGASGGGAPTAATLRLVVFGSGKFRDVKLPVEAPRQLPAAPPTREPPGSQPLTPGAASGGAGSAPASGAAPAPEVPPAAPPTPQAPPAAPPAPEAPPAP
ncbi:MAG TPA: S1C family serine protease [Polyangiaceae bacterium]|nr:S1C family serine protease [Polyangiaceae bacterium]